MPRTPDRFPGEREDEGIILDTSTEPPSQEGGLRYVSGGFCMRDSLGVFDPRSGGGGISESQHQVLRQLIHYIDNGPANGFASGAYRETLPSANPFPTSIIWWESNSKLKKIVEKIVTWNTSPKVPIQIQWKVYDIDGSTVLATLTDVISYSGVFEINRTRTIA